MVDAGLLVIVVVYLLYYLLVLYSGALAINSMFNVPELLNVTKTN